MANSRQHPAHDERLRLCDTLEQVGPDAPTLCSPWSTRDLAVHLAFRDRLMEVSPQRLVCMVKGKASKASFAAMDWPELVSLVRAGPPRLSPAGAPAVDKLLNTQEFYLHHEDVLRAAPGWAPRVLPADLERGIWKQIGLFARLSFRAAPVGVRLQAPGYDPKVAKKASGDGRGGAVTVKGTPGELVLYASGRQRVARVELVGDSGAAAALTSFGKS